MAAPRERFRVGVLGATGTVGQRFIQLLDNHPWFELHAIGASDRSAGLAYAVAAKAWKLPTPIPPRVVSMTVQPCRPEAFEGCEIVFSGLDSSVAGEVESAFAQAGVAVFSNSKNHRMDALVPLVVPGVNDAHLALVPAQQRALGYPRNGFIVCNANCSTTGLAVALKALDDKYGVDACMVTTMQAVSGAGYPGVASLDILDNVIPYISGEEDKMETEPLKILGGVDVPGEAFVAAPIRMSAHCNRVAVIDGHTECVSVKLRRPASSANEVAACMRDFRGSAVKACPSTPQVPIQVFDGGVAGDRPQPRLDRDAGRGFTVSVGRIRPCTLFDFKFVLLSHNTIIGAAGGALLNAETAVAMGLVKKIPAQ